MCTVTLSLYRYCQVAQRVHRENGLAGFWKGIAPSLVMVVNPTLQYILYEWLCNRLRDIRRGGAVPAHAAAGPIVRLTPRDVFMLSALAKLGATLVTYPMLLIKSRLQVSVDLSLPCVVGGRPTSPAPRSAVKCEIE